MSKQLTRDALKQYKYKTKRVELPDGFFAFVREINASERYQIDANCERQDGTLDVAGIKRLLALYSIVDENGNRLFDKAEELNNLPCTFYERLVSEALQINKMQEEEGEGKKSD